MAFNVDEFIGDVLKDVSVNDASKQALLEVVKNPTVAKRLEESTLRQSDYSKKQAELNNLVKKNQEYWDSLTSWKTEKEQELTEREKKLASKGGSLDDGKSPDDVTREELQQLAQQSVAYQNTIMKLGMKHFKDFGEILDTDELLKIASKDKVNIVQAYDLYSKPKHDEIQKAEFDKALAKAREEGKEEAIKNFSLPTNEQPVNNSGVPHALDGLVTKDKAEGKYGVMAAVKAYTTDIRSGKRAGSAGGF